MSYTKNNKVCVQWKCKQKESLIYAPPPLSLYFSSYQSIIYFNYVKIILHICFWLDKTLLKVNYFIANATVYFYISVSTSRQIFTSSNHFVTFLRIHKFLSRTSVSKTCLYIWHLIHKKVLAMLTWVRRLLMVHCLSIYIYQN